MGFKGWIGKNLGPRWSFTVEKKTGNLHKIRLTTFQTQWMRYSITLNFKNFVNEMTWEKYLFYSNTKNKFWTHSWIKILTIWCITQAGNMPNENTSTRCLHSKQWFHEEQKGKFKYILTFLVSW